MLCLKTGKDEIIKFLKSSIHEIKIATIVPSLKAIA